MPHTLRRYIMAASFSKTLLLGHVGKDPEIKSTPGGKLVANLSVATTERYTNKQNEKVENTEWHNLVAFDRTAEIIRDYVKKGSKIFIEGKNRTRSWDDKDTSKKMYRTEVLVHSISLLDGRNNGSSNNDAEPAGDYANSYGGGATNNSGYDDPLGISDADIPF
jgi:single-strand DNA-binding protein